MSAPKTICYSQKGMSKRFEYQIPSKASLNQELEGKMLKRVETKAPYEITK